MLGLKEKGGGGRALLFGQKLQIFALISDFIHIYEFWTNHLKFSINSDSIWGEFDIFMMIL